MAIDPKDVKRLREETDAPMMECKNALEKAGGDFDQARQILRETGKAAAAKRADRTTSEGIAHYVTSADGKKAAGVVIECETDFVSGNDTFKALVAKVANAFLEAETSDPAQVMVDGEPVAAAIEQAVAVIRENIVLKKATFHRTEGTIAVYNHHNRKQASMVELEGTASNIKDAGYQVAVQTVAFAPSFLKKDDVPREVIEREIEIEKQRAINEGKSEDIAEKAAQGRVNKEFYQSQVLLEQPMYTDQKKSVTQYLQEEGKVGGGPISVRSYERIYVGMSA
ncbi:MAG: translation elongation factor Ts [Fimbriimonadaceae bacterium]|nr:translation elongation factor Ts [Fimbriimonadaceae bacterium]QYK54883.1 MAG: translation elongation factor Ts [Fimbriimonadaceae bacterium]